MYPFGSVENAVTPFRFRVHLKNAQAVRRNVFFKMSPAIPLIAVGLEQLIQGFDANIACHLLIMSRLDNIARQATKAVIRGGMPSTPPGGLRPSPE